MQYFQTFHVWNWTYMFCWHLFNFIIFWSLFSLTYLKANMNTYDWHNVLTCKLHMIRGSCIPQQTPWNTTNRNPDRLILGILGVVLPQESPAVFVEFLLYLKLPSSVTLYIFFTKCNILTILHYYCFLLYESYTY